MEHNPYAPPQTDIAGGDPEAVEIRKAHITHEASLRSVGFLYYLVGGLLVLSAMPVYVGGMAETGNNSDTISTIVAAILMAAIGILSIYVGTGLRRLRPWVRVPVGILSGLGLLNVPVGTLINGYILYLVFSRKGRMILSPDYATIIEQTPEVRYRTSIVVWVFVAILLAVLLAGIGLALWQGLDQ